MKKVFRIAAILLTMVIALQFLQSHTKPDYEPRKNVLKPKLSDYDIYEGNPADLSATSNYTAYSPAIGLFTDYADKRRLVKIPPGTVIKTKGDGLPEFPEGAMLVKTFYYDRAGTDNVRKLIETRIMINTNDGWICGTYKWNDSQTDAFLSEKGDKVPVTFTDSSGNRHSINYEIPQAKDCAKCHNSYGDFKPLGFKMRNLNHSNQVEDLINKGIIEKADTSKFGRQPDWRNSYFSLEERARGYLDVNCAHCHSEGGYCSIFKMRFGYDLPLNKTYIRERSDKILKLMAKKKMPYKGTTIIDDDGFDLIKQYLKTLE